MPTFAEMIFGGAQQQLSGPTAVDSGLQGISQGIQLAQQVEQIQANRQQLAQQREHLESAKLDKFVAAVEKGQQYSGKAQSNYYNKFLPQYRNILGLQDKFSDDALAFMSASPENLGRVQSLIADVRQGRITAQDAIATLNDPTQFADVQVTPELYKQLAAADVVNVENKQALTKQAIEIQSTGPKELAKKVSTDYAKFVTDGGLSGAEKKLNALRKVKKQLEDKSIVTGGIGSTLASGVGGDTGLALVNQKLKAAQDAVRSAISLKGSLDSQFSAREAEAAFGRAFDVKLTNAQNIEKIDSMISELESDLTNATDTYKQFGHRVPVSAGKAINKARVPSQLPPGVMDRIKIHREKFKNDPEKLKKYNEGLKKLYGDI